MRKNHAFTLIELLLFFAIFAIFSSIIVPSFLDYQKKIRLQSSVELIKTALYKSFSSARSQPKIFGVSGTSGKNVFQVFECDFPNCTTLTTIEIPVLRKNVLFNNSFKIKFLPPHGDPDFIGGDELKIFLNYDNKQEIIKIYKSSGLITNEN